MKKLLCLLVLVLLLGGAALAEENKIIPYPAEIQISMAYETWTTEDGTEVEVPLPSTCSQAVNDQLRAMVEKIWNETKPHFTPGGEYELQIMSTYRVSGQSWAGFLITGRVVQMVEFDSYIGEETLFLTYDACSFDMATGRPLTLGDVFPEESGVWNMIARDVQVQANTYYTGLPRDRTAMEAFCQKESLRALPILPSAGRIMLTAPLWETVEGKLQLMQFSLYYPRYRDMMTDEAKIQTDNSHRPIIAITYDDGPMYYKTKPIIRSLNDYGAAATFFCVGNSVTMWPDLVRQELDYGHSVGSHTFNHKYEYQVPNSYLHKDRVLCKRTHRELTGQDPWLFRAPGGSCKIYVREEVGWPIILWCFSAGDTGNNTANQLANHLIKNSEDGDIILMHDIHTKTATGTPKFLKGLQEKGFMFATVEELLCLHDIHPQPNQIYRSAYPEREDD